MKLSFIVTIDPVKDISLLSVLIHSLNLQTSDSFNVIFYNQTRIENDLLFRRLDVEPAFEYLVYNVKTECFLGQYPIWDLYELHNTLLDDNVLNDYFMSLHMEEFLDVDYIKHAIEVLEENHFDIMFGNLSRTQVDYEAIKPILLTRTPREFDSYLAENSLKRSHHWSFGHAPWFCASSLDMARENLKKLLIFRLRKYLPVTEQGYTRLRTYLAEDVYFMKQAFARQYNWFLRGHHMYFEDVHICEQKGACELSKELEKVTPFPVYFNRRKIYHIRHPKYYYQLVDDEFTQAMMRYRTDDPILQTHKRAIAMYRSGASLAEALAYTRKNPDGTGTQNANYTHHIRYLNNKDS